MDSATSPSGPAPARRLNTSTVLGLAVGALSVALVAAAMLYSPGRPPPDLKPDALVIHSRFYGMTVPASSVDAKNVRVVDLAAEPAWKPVTRTGGFGNPYYRAGTFRTANGRTVNLFTTGAQRLVLLPPVRENGTPVLLDVEQPEAFAARVREAWTQRWAGSGRPGSGIGIGRWRSRRGVTNRVGEAAQAAQFEHISIDWW